MTTGNRSDAETETGKGKGRDLRLHRAAPLNARGLSLASFASLAIAVVALLALAAPALAALPDNRAYEMVSPVEKGGFVFLRDLALADPSGEHVIVDGGVHNSLLSSGLSWMLETRTATGWSGAQVGPPPGTEASSVEQRATSLDAVSEDFSRFAFQTLMSLAPRDSGPSTDVYVREGPAGPLTWASGPPAPAIKVSEGGGELGNGECDFRLNCIDNDATFAGASADLADVVWSQYHPPVPPPAALPGSPPDTHVYGNEVYESVNGTAQLVGLVPAAEGPECDPSHGSCVVPTCGAAMGNASAGKLTYWANSVGNSAPTQGAVSGDGSQVIFTSPDPGTAGVPGCAPAGIYVRAGGTSTVQASASQETGGDPSGPKKKVYAGSSEEGGRVNTVFFTSKEELTETANTGVSDEGVDLYAYTMATPSRPAELVDLTPENNTPEKKFNEFGEEYESVEAIFLGSSTNGRLVYFTATSVLTGEPNSHGQTAKPGVSNLYMYEAATGHTTFIASGNGVQGPSLAGRADAHTGNLTSKVTPDGQHLVFVSSESLTTYRQEGDTEVYIYDAATNRLVCVSCNPSGAQPAASATLPQEFPEGHEDGVEAPATLPEPRVVSDDGSRVFFSSPDQLTVEAPSPAPAPPPLLVANELEPNVYEYEHGHIYLVAPAARLLTTTPSGNDVFFSTEAQLVPRDRDGSPDVYDARFAGGFPVLAAPACSGTSCQGVPAPSPIFATPASTTFSGVGNFPPPGPATTKPKPKPKACKKGFVRRRVKKHNQCVKRAKAKKSAKGRK
jgi:hypothetical protein